MRVGIDLLRVARLREARDSYYNRVYTDNERLYCKSFASPYEHYAGIFAAKEAVMKALSGGIDTFSFKDIEILHDETKKPYVVLTGNAKDAFENLHADEIEISISHTETDATAICVIQ